MNKAKTKQLAKDFCDAEGLEGGQWVTFIDDHQLPDNLHDFIAKFLQLIIDQGEVVDGEKHKRFVFELEELKSNVFEAEQAEANKLPALSSAGKEVKTAEDIFNDHVNCREIDVQQVFIAMEEYANQFKSTPSKDVPEDIKEEFYELGKKHNVPMHVLQQLRQVDNRYLTSILASKDISSNDIKTLTYEDLITRAEKYNRIVASEAEYVGYVTGAKWVNDWYLDQLKSKGITLDGDLTCQTCGNRNPAWYAENELFNKINGDENGVFCPLCFQNAADEKGINIMYKAVELPPVDNTPKTNL